MIQEVYCSFEVAKLLKEKGMEFTLKINSENLTQFEYSLIKMANTMSFNRRFFEEDTGKYAARRLLEIAYKQWEDKARKWLSENLDRYDNSIGLTKDEFIGEFTNFINKLL